MRKVTIPAINHYRLYKKTSNSSLDLQAKSLQFLRVPYFINEIIHDLINEGLLTETETLKDSLTVGELMDNGDFVEVLKQFDLIGVTPTDLKRLIESKDLKTLVLIRLFITL